MRADSGFCRQNLIRWCERAGVGYLIGLARNSRLDATVSMVEMAMREAYERTGTKQREIGAFHYAAASWDRERRVVTRLEYGAQGMNPRFVVTNLEAEPAVLYDELYCARGEAENRIKEAQLDLFGTRASCHRFEANQFRLLLAALAYTLMHRLRRIALVGTELERDAVSGVNDLGRPAKIIVVDYRAQHDPRAPAQDRRGDPAQHAPHPPDARLAPSDARGVRRRCPPLAGSSP